MARQRLPTLQPEPAIDWLTTGLTKGSRCPVAVNCFFGAASAVALPPLSAATVGLFLAGFLCAETFSFEERVADLGTKTSLRLGEIELCFCAVLEPSATEEGCAEALAVFPKA